VSESTMAASKQRVSSEQQKRKESQVEGIFNVNNAL